MMEIVMIVDLTQDFMWRAKHDGLLWDTVD